jgi:hypothetical protein
MTPTPLYSQRRASCGCSGLPEGQHLPGCDRHPGAEASACRRCGYRAATEGGCCAICGTSREAVPPAPAAPMLLSDAELEHPFGPGIDAPERLRWLRTATDGSFRLDLWDDGERASGGEGELAYRLCVAEGASWILVFAGEGFAAPGDTELGSDAPLAAIVGLLSLRPGETDPAFFDRYTDRQLAFVKEHGEALALWAAQLQDSGAQEGS